VSREQTFARLRRGIWRYVVPIAIIYQAATPPGRTVLRETVVAPEQVAPQTQDPVAPIFRCSGAGGNEVLVSLGQDGSSIFVSCTEVKS